MSEVLLIRLGSTAGEMIPWLVWSDTEQEVIASGEIADASQLNSLSSHAQSRDVKALVPTSDLTLQTVALPGKYSRQLVAALPFMLEEELAQDVDKLFFAIGNKTTLNDGPAVEVAIVDRTLMDNWSQWLADGDIQCTVMLPDALCLPLHDEGISGIEFNQQWLVRSAVFACNSVDVSWFDDYLSLSATQLVGVGVGNDEDEDEGEAKRKGRDHGVEKEIEVLPTLKFHSYSPYFSETPGLEVIEQSAELPLKLLVANASNNSFNLLQGEYSKKKEGSKSWSIWRQAAIVAAVAIILQLTFRGTVAWQLGSELEAEKAAFLSQYKKAFPTEKRVRSALVERQLKSKLKAIKGGDGGEGGFLAMLDKVGPVFKQTQGLAPNSIKFDSKRRELRVQATGDGFQSFEKFKSAVETLGYEVQQGSLNNDGDKVVGAITIKRAG